MKAAPACLLRALPSALFFSCSHVAALPARLSPASPRVAVWGGGGISGCIDRGGSWIRKRGKVENARREREEAGRAMAGGLQQQAETTQESLNGAQAAPEASSSGGVSRLTVGGFAVEGVSVGGQETCLLLPRFKVAFDIGRCPPRAVAVGDCVLVSHAHLDHIGGLGFHVATRDLLSMKPPNVVLPAGEVANTKAFLEALHRLDHSWDLVPEGERNLRVNLIGMNVGEEYRLNKEVIVRPFRTYHCIPSQGYVLYSVKQKLRAEFCGLPGQEIGKLRKAGVEVTYSIEEPEVAFTGDTTAEWITDPANADALKAKLLIMEVTFVDDSVTVEHARKFGHTKLSEVIALADKFQNKAILFIHFSARYKRSEIEEAISSLPPSLRERTSALLERF